MTTSRVEQCEVDAFLALPPSGQFSSLCADIRDQIVLFVGLGTKGGAWLSLTLVNKQWYDCVAQCLGWERVFQSRFPFTYSRSGGPPTVNTEGEDGSDSCGASWWRMQIIKRGIKFSGTDYDSLNGAAKPKDTSDSHAGVGALIGSSLSSAASWMKSLVKTPPAKKVMILGLDNAGKTTMLYRIKQTFPDDQILPTRVKGGFSVEMCILKGKVDFTCWDLGGQDKIRPLLRHYWAVTQAIIFVVDSLDEERLKEAKKAMMDLLHEEHDLQGIPLLVLANKQDLPGALSVETVAARLELDTLSYGALPRQEVPLHREWCIMGSSAVKEKFQAGTGLYDGVQWLGEKLNVKL